MSIFQLFIFNQILKLAADSKIIHIISMNKPTSGQLLSIYTLNSNKPLKIKKQQIITISKVNPKKVFITSNQNFYFRLYYYVTLFLMLFQVDKDITQKILSDDNNFYYFISFYSPIYNYLSILISY